MKSSNSFVAEQTATYSWQPEEFVIPNKPAAALMTDQLLAILKPVAAPGEPALPPLPVERKALIRVGDRRSSDFQAWQPGVVEPVVIPVTRPVAAAPQHASFAAPTPEPEHITKDLLAEAHSKAEEIINQARQTAEDIIRQGVVDTQKSIDQGYLKGLETAKAEAASSMQAALSMITELTDWREQSIAENEEAILDMIRQIARLMFGNGMQLDKDTLQAYLNEVVEKSRSLGDLTIVLNPNDLSRLEPAWAEYHSQIRGNRVRVIGSASISAGGCFVKGQMGSVDALVETKLTAVLESLEPEAEMEIAE